LTPAADRFAGVGLFRAVVLGAGRLLARLHALYHRNVSQDGDGSDTKSKPTGGNKPKADETVKADESAKTDDKPEPAKADKAEADEAGAKEPSKAADATKPAPANTDDKQPALAKPDAKADLKTDAKQPAKAADKQPAKAADKRGGVVAEAADVPETRRHETTNEPPARQSYHDMMNPVVTYPDDGVLAMRLRAFDNVVGKAEQVVLVSLLAFVVFIAASHALADKLANINLYDHFKDDVIRAGTFAMALIGGAFASHQSKHLSMDLISRRLSPRTRLFLKITLALFTIFVVLLLIRAGFHTITNERSFPQKDKLITPVRIAYLVPLGGILIIFHTVIHTIIDIDYIARRKTPPERMRSGH